MCGHVSGCHDAFPKPSQSNWKIIVCMCEDKSYISSLSHTLVRSVYGNNYFRNYDLEGNLLFNSVSRGAMFRTVED